MVEKEERANGAMGNEIQTTNDIVVKERSLSIHPEFYLSLPGVWMED